MAWKRVKCTWTRQMHACFAIRPMPPVGKLNFYYNVYLTMDDISVKMIYFVNFPLYRKEVGILFTYIIHGCNIASSYDFVSHIGAYNQCHDHIQILVWFALFPLKSVYQGFSQVRIYFINDRSFPIMFHFVFCHNLSFAQALLQQLTTKRIYGMNEYRFC